MRTVGQGRGEPIWCQGFSGRAEAQRKCSVRPGRSEGGGWRRLAYVWQPARAGSGAYA